MKQDAILVKLAPHSIRTVERSAVLKIDGTDKVLVLNPVAATIVNDLRENVGSQLSIDAIVATIQQRFDIGEIPLSTVRRDVQETLNAFVENGLLVP